MGLTFLKRGRLLTRLLRFQLVQLSLLPVDLRLLRLKPLLDCRILLLPRLHLIANQRAAEKSDSGANAGAGAGIASGAADNRA